MKELTAIKGIGRKTANVIMKVADVEFEGVMNELHVIRAEPRIGIISQTKNGTKVEKELIAALPREI